MSEERSSTPLVIAAVFGVGAGVGLAIWGCWLGYGAIKDAGFEECQRTEVRDLTAQLEAEQEAHARTRAAFAIVGAHIYYADPNDLNSVFGDKVVPDGAAGLIVKVSGGGNYKLIPIRNEQDKVIGYTVK